ncbi:Protein priB [Leucoagaricus sp. SymC.cos]|nr:Protein priB [Leucoagaricus sp. SymC.cos]
MIHSDTLTSSPGPVPNRFPNPNGGVTQTQRTYYPQQNPSGGSFHQSKRPRPSDRPTDEDHDVEANHEKESGKKHGGACARCKNLKVKCEFITDPDTCKRCLNGGHECIIPGRKKRRVPPVPVFTEGNRAIEDWLAQAKESFLQFGNSISRNYLSDEDSDSTGFDDDEYEHVGREDVEGDGDEGGAIDISVESIENDPMHNQDTVGQRLRLRDSNSSLNTTTTSVAGSTGQPRKKGSGDKPSNLPTEAAPWGLMGRLSLIGNPGGENPDNTGITSSGYFTSKDAEDEHLKNIQRVQPHILSRSIISTSDAEKLFTIYFDKMNDSTSLLDPKLYTPPLTAVRSPFLFTVICAVASRFFEGRSDLYPQLMHYAQLAAGTALISGIKNVDMCAAYILLSLYPVPTRRMTEQRSWLYLGLAIRTATDLNLHIPVKEKPRNEWQAREILNRTRIWLNCYNLDRSTGSQYGKPPIISNADYVANHSAEWYKGSQYNIEHFDIHICVYNAELRVMASFMANIHNDPEQPTGLNKNADFEAISTATDDELQALGQQWFALLEKTTDMTVPRNRFRTGLLRLAYSYSRLIALSYGFQHAFGKNTTDENPFLNRCLNAARDVVNAVLDDICRPEQLFWWRHGPEAQSIFVTFAAAFLIKLLQPRFASHLSLETRAEIKGLVQKVVELLSSKDIAIDERHGPGLYARFLRNLLQSPILRQDSLPRRSRITKSAGATPELSDHASLAPMSNQPSPARSGGSLSPPPSQEMISFDMFAPIGLGATDPYFPGLDTASPALGLSYMTAEATTNGRTGSSTGTMSDMLMPPLSGDDYLLQNMQALGGNSNSNSFDWQSNSGYAQWFPQLQQNMGMNVFFDPSGYSQSS